MDEASFRIWDSENYGRLDAFEIFSGLILFAKAIFEDKARFLFEIFDMNETGIMEINEIEFMLNTCLFSLFKIKNIKDSVDEDEISAFVEKNFVDDTKLDFSAFFKWINRNKYIWMCLKAVDQQSNFTANENNNINICRIDGKPNYLVDLNDDQLSDEESEVIPTSQNLNINFQDIYDHLKTFMDNNLEFPSRKTATEVQSLTISGIFGINLKNIKHNMTLHSDKTQAGKSEKLIYSVNNIVVIYYHRLNLQDYYLNHKSTITAISVSKGNLVASAEGLSNSQINVWDIKTKETIYILTQTHVSAINMMKFMDNDKKLVTISKSKRSHIFIHDLENEEMTFSFNDPKPVTSICYNPSVLFENRLEFYLLGEKHISVIREIEENKKIIYKHENLDVSKIKQIETIVCGCICSVPSGKQFLLTGHNDGRIITWENHQFKNVKKKYKNGVIKIAYNDIGYFVLLKNCQLIIWDPEFEMEIKKIDFSKKRPFSADFSNFVNIIAKESDIFLITNQGQVFRYKLQFKEQQNTLTQQMETKLKHQADRFKAIFAINIPNNGIRYLFHNEQEYIAFVNKNKEIALLYLEENDCNYKIKFEENIVDFDIRSSKLGLHLIVASDNNEVGYYINNKLRSSKIFKDAILKVMLVNKTESIVVLTKRNNVYKYNKKDDSFFNNEGTSLKLYESDDNLIDMVFLEDTQQIILISKKSFIYTCDLKLFNKFIQLNSKQKLNIENFQCRSYINGKNASIASYLSYDNLCACTTADTFYVFPDRNRLKKKQYLKQSFGESSCIIDMNINSNKGELYLFLKNMIIKYKINTIRRYLNDPSYTGDQHQMALLEPQSVQLQTINDGIYFMNSFRYIKKIDNKVYDDFKIFLDTVCNEVPLTYKNSDINNEDSRYYKNRFPPISLTLEYIYGIDTSIGKDCVNYCHIGYVDKNGDVSNIDNLNNFQRNKSIKVLKLSNNEAREIIFSKYKYKPYYETHANCSRNILYYFDKYAIVYDPRFNVQKHYTDHKNKINCLCLSPCKRIVATGETQLNYSCRVNVWFAVSQLTIVTILLKSIVVAKMLVFSCKGDYLIVLGVDDNNNYCIEVYYWRNSELQCFSILGDETVNELIPHNYHNTQFTIVENQALKCFNIEGRNLNCKVRYDNFEMGDSSISALIYFYYILGDEVDNDYIIGKTDGSLGLITFGKYKVIHEEAHKGSINILKITDVMEKVVIIISAGEDQIICFWDSKLELIKKLDLSLCPVWKLHDKYNHSASSLDIYACSPPNTTNLDKEADDYTAIILLVATKNNEVIEIKLKTEYKGIREEEDENEKFFIKDREDLLDVSHKNIIIKQILFDYNLVFKYNSNKNNKKKNMLDFVINDSGAILVTFNKHNDIFFWDIKRNTLLYEKRLEKKIKCVKFLGCENVIIILYKNNSFEFYSLGIVQVANNPFYIKNCILVNNFQYQSDHNISHFEVRSTEKGYSIISFIESRVDNNSNKHNIVLVWFMEVYILSEDIVDLKLSLADIGEISMMYEREDHIFQKSIDEALILRINSYQISDDSTTIYIEIKKILKNFKTDKITKVDYFHFFFDLLTFKQKQINEISKSTGFKKFLSENDLSIYGLCLPRDTENMQNLDIITKATSKVELDNYMILGTENGELILCKMFYPDNMDHIDSSKKLKKQGKPISAHSKSIKKILLDSKNNTLFAISDYDNCLTKWSISFSNKQWEMDHQIFSFTKDNYTGLDLYFENFIDRRKEIKHLKKLIQAESPQFNMSLDRVLSRRAADRYNNMFSVLGDCILFSTDSLIVIMHTRNFDKINLKDNIFEQEFFMLEKDMDEQFTCPEISTFTRTIDMKIVCVGTAEDEATLYFFDINSKQFLRKLALIQLVIITHIKYSYDSKYLLVIGLNKQKRQILFLLDVSIDAYILTSIELSYSDPYKIKDAGFFPGERHKFMTVGEQHITEWTYNSGILNFKELKLERSHKMDKGGLLNIIQEKRISKNKSNDEKNVR